MLEFLRKGTLRLITSDEYSRIYNKFGGSLITDINFIQALEELANFKVKFYAKFIKNEPVFAVATYKDYIFGDRKSLKLTRLNRHIDLGRPAIMSVSNDEFKCKFKSHYILENNNFLNAKKIPNRSLALLKQDGISSKFQRDLRRYWKHFYNESGNIKKINDFDSKEISEIFIKLHFERWQQKPMASESLEKSFKMLRNFLFGNVLFLKNEPVCIQIIYKTTNAKYTSLEYINGGMHTQKSKNNINLGNLLIDLNTNEAREIAKQTNTKLLYSFGLYNVEYKKRWCDEIALYKSGLL